MNFLYKYIYIYMDFKNKYLKYKYKYLELKNHGGSGHLKDEELLRVRAAIEIANQLSDESSDDYSSDPDDDSNDKKPALDRKISIPQVKEYIEYLDFINKHEIIFTNTFTLHGFELKTFKGNIYISKIYNYNGKKIYLKLSLHNYSDPNRDNHVHIIKYEEAVNEKDTLKYKNLLNKSSSGILVKKDGSIFKRHKYDYFSFNFSFNEKNKLLFDLELKSNLKNYDKYFEKWSLNYDLISIFMDEIGDNIGRSFIEIVMYNFYNNVNFYKLIKQILNEISKDNLLTDENAKILNLLNNNKKIDSEDDKINIFYLWKNLINQNKIDLSSLIINPKIKKFHRNVKLKNIESYKNELKSLVGEDYLKTISQKDIINNLSNNLSAVDYLRIRNQEELVYSFKEDFKKEVIKIFNLEDESFTLKLDKIQILNLLTKEKSIKGDQYVRELKINDIKNFLPRQIYLTIKKKMENIGAKKIPIGSYLKLIEEKKKIYLFRIEWNEIFPKNFNLTTNEIIKLINQDKNPKIIYDEIEEWRNQVKRLTNGRTPGKAKAFRNMQLSPEDFVRKKM